MQGAIDETLNGLATSGAVSAAYTLDLTASFVAATSPIKAVIDTDILGFQAAWRVDVTASYSRHMSVQHIENSEFSSLSIDETL